MVVIKLQYQNEIRRITFDDMKPAFSELVQLATAFFFSNTNSNAPIVFKYKDDEDDLITVGCDRELQEALASGVNDNDVLKLFVERKQVPFAPPRTEQGSDRSLADLLEGVLTEPVVQNLLKNFNIDLEVVRDQQPRQSCQPEIAVHYGVSCDGCEQKPLSGARYKCLVCDNYDLCEKCYTSGVHAKEQHSFQQINRPIRYGGWPGCARRSPCNPAAFQRRGCCPSQQQPQQQQEFVHSAVCDVCDQQIKGIRYKCQVCPDYDQCEKCFNEKETKQTHDSAHSFTKITRPVFCGRPFWMNNNASNNNNNSPGCARRCPMRANQCGSKPQQESPVNIPVSVPETTPVPQEVPIKVEEKVVEPVQPQVTTPVVPETVPETPAPELKKEANPFEAKLQQLEDMGFENRALNIELLVKYKGDMIATVRNLLEF